MKLRPHHLACFLLLLTTFGIAEGPATPAGQLRMDGSYLSALLGHHASGLWTELARADRRASWIGHADDFLPTGAPAAEAANLTPDSLQAARTPWTMRHPAAHAAALQSVTAHGRATSRA